MTRIPTFAVAGSLLVAAACGYDITTAETQASGAVATHHAPGLAFATGTTFAIVSALGVVTDDPASAGTAAAPGLVSAVASDLEARGFAKAADVDPGAPPAVPVAADLVVNLTALEAAQGTGAYWEASAGHFAPAVFGFPDAAWAYGWPAWAPLPAMPGTVLVELGDLRPGVGDTLTVIWAAQLVDVKAEGSAGFDSAAALDALAQAFAQSPYLDAGGTP